MQLEDLALDCVDISHASLAIELSNLVLFLLDSLTNVKFLFLAILEVFIVATVLVTLPPHKGPHNLARPENTRASGCCPARCILVLKVAALKNCAKLSYAALTILEHREGHTQNFINERAVVQHVIQVLDHRD